MNLKNFNKFIKNNKKTIKYNHNNKHVMMIDRGKFLSGINNLMVVMVLNKIFKLNPIMITDFRNPVFFKFYKSFGIKKFKIGFRYMLIFKKFNIFINSLITFIKAIFLLKIRNFDWFIDNFKVQDIKIGDLIYDTYIRYEHRYLDPKVDFEFANLLFKAIFRTYNLCEYMSLYPTKFLLVGTTGYCHNDGIALRVALKRKIKVIEAQPHQLIKLNQNMIDYGLDNLASNFFNKGKKFIVNDKKVENFIKKKNKGEIGSLYTGSVIYFRANKNKTKINKSKLLTKLNLEKK
jgi:hypothetical protein